MLNRKIILASNSDRRKEILSKLGLEFSIKVSDIDETIDEENSLTEEIKKLAYKKAKRVFDDNRDVIVIGSDTVVCIENIVLGKPVFENEDDLNFHIDKNKKFHQPKLTSKQMIKLLSGRDHEVITSLCVMSENRVFCDVSIAKVSFTDISESEIEEYVKSSEPNDKAGAYAIQGMASKFIKKIDGDFYSIMGLPLNMLYEELKTNYGFFV